MKAGSGEMARIYFSLKGEGDERKAGNFAVDSTTVPPANSLMLVDVNAKTIVPYLKITGAAAGKEAEKVEKKVTKPAAKKGTTKK